MGMDNSQSGIVAMITIMVVIAMASTVLRFWSRAVVLRGQYCMDDWLALAALPPTLVLLALGMALAYNGAGKPATNLPLSQVETCAKMFFVSSFFFDFSMVFAKFSALAFYKRVFGSGRNRSSSWTISFFAAIAVTFAWFALALLYGIFRCNPVRGAWSITTQRTCPTSFDTYMLVMGSVNVFADVVIVLLPIPQILNLKMKARRKFVVVFLLLIGYCVPLLSIGRVVTIVQLRGILNHDFTLGLIDLGFWILAEPSMSLLAISLPACLQLFMRAWRYGPRALFTSRDYNIRPGRRLAGYLDENHPKFHALRNHDYEFSRSDGKNDVYCARNPLETEGTSRSKSVPVVDEDSLESFPRLQVPDGIHIKTDIRVTYDE